MEEVENMLTRRALVQFESDYRMHLADALKLQGVVQVYHPLKISLLHQLILVYSGVRRQFFPSPVAVSTLGWVMEDAFEDTSKNLVRSI